MEILFLVALVGALALAFRRINRLTADLEALRSLHWEWRSHLEERLAALEARPVAPPAAAQRTAEARPTEVAAAPAAASPRPTLVAKVPAVESSRVEMPSPARAPERPARPAPEPAWITPTEIEPAAQPSLPPMPAAPAPTYWQTSARVPDTTPTAQTIAGPAESEPEPVPARRHRAGTLRRHAAPQPAAAVSSAAVSGSGWNEPPAPAPTGPSPWSRVVSRIGLAAPEGGVTVAAIQEWLEGRLLAVVGGVALLVGFVFFLGLAFSRGWITPEMRVAGGLFAGTGLMVLGEIAFGRLRGILGHVLVAVGLAVLELSFLAATRLFGLVPPEWGLAGAFVAAIAAAVIAVRHDSQLVAALGLVAVLAAPPTMGASANVVTLLFVAATLAGTTGVALYRTWSWLPLIAFVLAAPQVASYAAGGPAAIEGLVVVVGFWLVNLVAAGGEEARRQTDRLRPGTVTLLLADVAFTAWAAFAVLSGGLAAWQGLFIGALGVAHLAVAAGFLVRFGDRHPFGLLVAATGVAGVAMAVPIRYGGPPVPIAWAAEAAALTWLAVMRRHPYSAALAALLGTLSLVHLVAIEYPPGGSAWIPAQVPLTGPAGLAFDVFIVALVATGLVARLAWLRAWLATIGGVLALWVLSFELSGPALVTAWSLLGAAGLVTWHHLVAPRLPEGFRETNVDKLGLPGFAAPTVQAGVAAASVTARQIYLGAALLGCVAVAGHLLALDYPPGLVVAGFDRAPFAGDPALALLGSLAALVVAGALIPVAWVRAAIGAVGVAALAWALPFELSGTGLVAAWAALGTAVLVVEARLVQPRLRSGRWALRSERALLASGLVVAAAPVVHLFAYEYAVDALNRTQEPWPFADERGLAFGLVLLSLAATGWLVRVGWVRVGLTALAGLLALWTLPFEVSGVTLAWGWAILATAAFALESRIVGPSADAAFVGPSQAPLARALLRPSIRVVGVLTGLVLIGRVLAADLPVARFAREPLSQIPFVGPEGGTLLAVLAAMAVSGWLLERRWIRLGMAGLALLLVTYATGFELIGPTLQVAWAVLGLGAILVARRLGRLSLRIGDGNREDPFTALAERTPFVAAALAAVFMVGLALGAAPAAGLAEHLVDEWLPLGTPFLDERTAIVGTFVLFLLGVGLAWAGMTAIAMAVAAASLVVAWLLPFEVRPGYAVAAWVALAVTNLRLAARTGWAPALLAVAAAEAGAVLAVTLGVVARPDRLIVDATTTVQGWQLLSDASVALVAITAGFAFVAWTERGDLVHARRLAAAAGAVGVYLLSIAVVDWFQRQVGTRPLADAQGDGQVGLTILWAALGGFGFAAGLVSGRVRIRLFGLALLGMAAAKAFLVDMVGLPVEWRVLSLLIVGALLLLSAFAYARLGHPRGPAAAPMA